MVILYELNGNLYVNLTNRCPCACTFCLRQLTDEMNHSGSLWLEREPSVEEVLAEFDKFDMSRYAEVVFCGFGEPTERLEDVITIAKYVKQNFQKTIRLNTNGLSDLIYNRNTAPDFEGAIDIISISLNAPTAAKYLESTRSKFGIGSFDSLLRFAGNVAAYVPKVVLSTVDTTLTAEEENACREICHKIGVTYRIREFDNGKS